MNSLIAEARTRLRQSYGEARGAEKGIVARVSRPVMYVCRAGSPNPAFEDARGEGAASLRQGAASSAPTRRGAAIQLSQTNHGSGDPCHGAAGPAHRRWALALWALGPGLGLMLAGRGCCHCHNHGTQKSAAGS